MIFDCLNEALDGKRVLGLKGCPLPVDLVSVFQQGPPRLHKMGSSGPVRMLKEAQSKTSNTQSQHWKTQNSKSESYTENSVKVSAVKNSLSRSQHKNLGHQLNKENFGQNSLTGYGLFAQPKKPRDPLVKVFEKTAEQIKKWALFMCGMYEHKPENFKYLPEIVNPVILEKIKESRMTLLEMNEMEELGYKMNDFDDEKYEIGLNLNDFVWDHLINEVCQEFLVAPSRSQNNSEMTQTSRENLEKTETAEKTEQHKKGSGNPSEVIPTEEAITKLEYFPNYSCTYTEKSPDSRSLLKTMRDSGNELIKSTSLQLEKKSRVWVTEDVMEKNFKINTEIKAKKSKQGPSKIKNIKKINFKKFEPNGSSPSFEPEVEKNRPLDKSSNKIEIVVNKTLSKKIKQLKKINLKPSFSKAASQNS